MVINKLKWSSICVLFLFYCFLGRSEEFSSRYWPYVPAPTSVVMVKNANALPFSEGLLVQSLAGLLARRSILFGEGELAWLDFGSESYREWWSRCHAYLNFSVKGEPLSVWDLLDYARAKGVVRGYVLCSQDHEKRAPYTGSPRNWSVNVATALAPIFWGIPVEESLEPEIQNLGIPLLLDVRDKDEKWLWQKFGHVFSKKILARVDPLTPVGRQEIVAYLCPVASETNNFYEQVLESIRPGSPIFGWGFGDEKEQVAPTSQYGLFYTATNWCLNLPLLSSGKTGLEYPIHPFCEDVSSTYLEGEQRYISFILSDGDNVQWLMSNFCHNPQYWASKYRGEISFGWTIPAVDLLQLCPYTLDYLRDTATSQDDFVLASGGYFYPDLFGNLRNRGEILRLHARRAGKYMERCGLRTISFICVQWDSPDAIEAYQVFAEEIPFLEGIFVVQYFPYTAGRGKILWIRANDDRIVPVISARYAIWANRGDNLEENTPTRIAAQLRQWAEKPAETFEDRFAWVVVHAWSWFKNREGIVENLDEDASGKISNNPSNIACGYSPAVWCAEQLPSSIKIVKPIQLVRLVRLAYLQSDTFR